MRQTERVQAQATEAAPLLAGLSIEGVGQGVGRGGEAVEVGIAIRPAQGPVHRQVWREGVAPPDPGRGRGEAVGLRIAVGLVRR